MTTIATSPRLAKAAVELLSGTAAADTDSKTVLPEYTYESKPDSWILNAISVALISAIQFQFCKGPFAVWAVNCVAKGLMVSREAVAQGPSTSYTVKVPGMPLTVAAITSKIVRGSLVASTWYSQLHASSRGEALRPSGLSEGRVSSVSEPDTTTSKVMAWAVQARARAAVAASRIFFISPPVCRQILQLREFVSLRMSTI